MYQVRGENEYGTDCQVDLKICLNIRKMLSYKKLQCKIYHKVHNVVHNVFSLQSYLVFT